MSIDIMSRVWKTEVGSHTAKLVLMSLADNANDAGVCWPSLATIGKRCELSRQSVIDQIRKLKDMGFLTHENDSRPSNTYTITVPEVVNGVDQGSQRHGLLQSTALTRVVNGVDPNHQGTIKEPSVESKTLFEPRNQVLEAVPVWPVTPRPAAVEVAEPRKPKAMSVPDAPLVIPAVLSGSPEFVAKWDRWMTARRALRKPKNWSVLFQEQLEWLAKYSPEVAVEILSASIMNGWQGLFPPKNGHAAAGNGKVPAWQERKEWQDQLKRAEDEIKTLMSGDSHADLDWADKATLKRARGVRDDMRQKLGYKI